VKPDVDARLVKWTEKREDHELHLLGVLIRGAPLLLNSRVSRKESEMSTEELKEEAGLEEAGRLNSEGYRVYSLMISEHNICRLHRTMGWRRTGEYSGVVSCSRSVKLQATACQHCLRQTRSPPTPRAIERALMVHSWCSDREADQKKGAYPGSSSRGMCWGSVDRETRGTRTRT